jgi:hypothetical protein
MKSTEQLLNPLVLVILLGLAVYVVVFLKARKAKVTALRADYDFAYACIIESLAKASAEFRGKFHDLPPFDDPTDLHLVRFGLFNIGHGAIEIDHYRRPIKLTFTGSVEILSATFGEAIKSPAATAPPEIDGNSVILAPFHINGGGTVIFNLVVRGDPARHVIDSNIDNFDEIRLFG